MSRFYANEMPRKRQPIGWQQDNLISVLVNVVCPQEGCRLSPADAALQLEDWPSPPLGALRTRSSTQSDIQAVIGVVDRKQSDSFAVVKALSLVGSSTAEKYTTLNAFYESVQRLVADSKKLRQLRARPSASIRDQSGSAPEDLSPKEVIARLSDADTSLHSRIQAVLQAESLAFDASGRPQLVELLRSFVRKERDSNDANTQTAVAAAIRKLVSNVDDADFGTVSELLQATGRMAVSPSVELEVSKTVVRRLSSHLPESNHQYAELAERLYELVNTYVNPRLLPREQYGAIAMNAVHGLLMLKSGRESESIDRVAKANVAWFSELLVRRAEVYRGQLISLLGESEANDACSYLIELIDRLSRKPAAL